MKILILKNVVMDIFLYLIEQDEYIQNIKLGYFDHLLKMCISNILKKFYQNCIFFKILGYNITKLTGWITYLSEEFFLAILFMIICTLPICES